MIISVGNRIEHLCDSQWGFDKVSLVFNEYKSFHSSFTHITEIINRYKKVSNELSQQLLYEPSIEQVAVKMKIDSDKLKRMVERYYQTDPISLDLPLYEEELNGPELRDGLVSDDITPY